MLDFLIFLVYTVRWSKIRFGKSRKEMNNLQQHKTYTYL